MHLVLRAFRELARVQYLLWFRHLPAVYAYVTIPERERRGGASRPPSEICGAVETACIWFFKDVSCLHRSAVTARLLKQYGVNAQMVIGAQSLPFKAHAWVEVDGEVINDKPYVREMYPELDRL